MNELESLGIIELDDERTRVRQTDGSLTRISELLAGAGVTMAQVQSTVNAAVAAAIASLVSGAPEALNTLSEISSALNQDPNAYATLLALIQAKNPLLTFPSSSTSINLLSGSTLRAIEAVGASLTESSDRVTLTVDAVSNSTFSTFQSANTLALAGKQASLVLGSGSGTPFLDGNVIRRLDTSGDNVTMSVIG